VKHQLYVLQGQILDLRVAFIVLVVALLVIGGAYLFTGGK
jgi:hypothetical protein